MSSPLLYLDAALAHKLITRKQHKHIADELMSFPGATAEELMLRRHFITQDQLQYLYSLPQDQLSSPDQETVQAARQQAAPAQYEPKQLSQNRPAQKIEDTSSVDEKRAQSAAVPKTLKDMLLLARHWGCSDLHICVGRTPFVRLAGQIRYMEMDPLNAEQAEELNFSMLTEEQASELREKQTLDFALEMPGMGRHRCNVFHHRTGWDGSYRIVSLQIPTLDQLGLPPAVRTLTEYHQGMVLVTGPGRSGKTTTIAAMIDMINKSREDHIITVEDPIEYVHTAATCQVTQREIGKHSRSFSAALRGALREDPDIILVGEMRDLETISIAITASETGHLVFGTLHTGSAARTVSRILDAFPINQQDQVRVMISESIRGVLSQRLMPRRDGQGLVLGMEVLVVNSAVSSLIKEDKLHQLASTMQAGKRLGMQTMDDCLMELMRQGYISGIEAHRQCENKQLFESYKNQE